MPHKIVVAALYKFVTLKDFASLRQPLLAAMKAHGVKGTLLLAEEGINGTISGSRSAIDGFLAVLRSDARLADIDHKESYCDKDPFYRSKVKLKKEIVTIGVVGVDPNKQAGTYVSPVDWNTLIADPDVLLIDTRNDYEVALGTFEGAADPGTSSFGEFPKFVGENLDPARHRKVAMFCTGGIRCEKASAHLLARGFAEVYHLKGGIRRKWSSLGATVVYGDYAEYLDQIGPAALALGVTDSTLRRYGGGIAQEIDAASMTVYLKYEHYDASVRFAPGAPVVSGLEDADFVSLGALINF